MPGTRWEPANEIEVARLWLAGEMSAAEIGAEMNMTRNMIIGKARRLGLPTKAVGAPGRPRGSRDRVPRTVSCRPSGAIPPQEEAILAEDIGLMELESHHCRYIVGHGDDGLARYCGQQKTTWQHPRSRVAVSVSYCRAHSLLCYQA